MSPVKNLLCCIGLLFGLSISTVSAQQDHAAIRLYVDPGRLDTTLSPAFRERIYIKVTQWITQTGIAEQGFSNFFVVPTFYIVDSSVDASGMSPIYLKQCELSLTVERHAYGKRDAAVFNSLSKRFAGSGGSEQAALTNAINNLSTDDPDMIAFMRRTREKISAYYQANCQEVIVEADQAKGLGDFARSIALYFSIPSDAPADCYAKALSGLHNAYRNYVDYDCSMKLIQLRAYVARANSMDSAVSHADYDSALAIIQDLDPASTQCYSEAQLLINKIEGRFDEQQRQTWQLKQQQVSNEGDAQKIMIERIAKINSTYQPPPAPPTIVIQK